MSEMDIETNPCPYCGSIINPDVDTHTIKRCRNALADALRATREELAKARAEMGALGAQVANWERKEIARASCCVDNEREAKELRAARAELDAARAVNVGLRELLRRAVKFTGDTDLTDEIDAALTPAAEKPALSTRVDAFDAWYEAAGRPWSDVTDVEAALRAQVTQSADEHDVERRLDPCGFGCGAMLRSHADCPVHGRKEGA